MTDKVESIRGKLEHVIERRLNLLRGEWFDLTEETVGLMNEVFDIFTEESMTSVWCDSSKEPLKPLGTRVLVLFNDGALESLTIEDMKAIGGVIKWAYVDDLLKLLNYLQTKQYEAMYYLVFFVAFIILLPIIVVIIDEVWDWIDKKYKKK